MLRSPFLLLLLVALVGVVNADVAIDVVKEDEVFQEDVVEAEEEEQEGEHAIPLDKDREAILFKVEQRSSGFTYTDKFELGMNQEMNIGGMDVKTTTSMEMESETHVQDLAEGGQGIDITFSHASMSMDAGIMSIDCDTDKPSKEGDMASDMACGPLNDLVGTTFHNVLDDEGTLVIDEDGPDMSLGSKQFEQTSRLLKLVPNDVPIKPGDSWDASEDLGDIGTFTADGFLQGYTDYNDIDCAVIYLTGTLDMDMKKAMEMIGGGDIPGAEGITVSDATMDTTIYYDYDSSLIRWSQATINMVITMPNPMSPGGSPITVPTNEVVTTTTNIKKDD